MIGCFSNIHALFPPFLYQLQMVEKHRINQFYTAPTAIRLLIQHGSIREHGQEDYEFGGDIFRDCWSLFFLFLFLFFFPLLFSSFTYIFRRRVCAQVRSLKLAGPRVR